MIAAGAPADCEPRVRQSAKVQFGDYQANGMMKLRKTGYGPRQICRAGADSSDPAGTLKVEIAGPRFLSIFSPNRLFAEQVQPRAGS